MTESEETVSKNTQILKLFVKDILVINFAEEKAEELKKMMIDDCDVVDWITIGEYWYSKGYSEYESWEQIVTDDVPRCTLYDEEFLPHLFKLVCWRFMPHYKFHIMN